MQPPTPPKPPEHILVTLQVIARRWDSYSAAVEKVLRENDVEILDVPQRPRKGCRLSDLLSFEARWRLTMEQERQAQVAAHKDAIERGRRRKEEADRRVVEALEQEAGR
jgi:hypothetical protein